MSAQIWEWKNEFAIDVHLAATELCQTLDGKEFRAECAMIRWSVDHTEDHRPIRASHYAYLTVTLIGPLVNDPGASSPQGHRQGSRRLRQERGGEWDELPEWLLPAMKIAETAYHEFCAKISAN